MWLNGRQSSTGPPGSLLCRLPHSRRRPRLLLFCGVSRGRSLSMAANLLAGSLMVRWRLTAAVAVLGGGITLPAQPLHALAMVGRLQAAMCQRSTMSAAMALAPALSSRALAHARYAAT